MDNSGASWIREDSNLYDVFEPNYLKSALSEPQKTIVLGHLIFGSSEWVRLGGVVPSILDPLTALFKKRGMSSCMSFLC